MSSTSGAERISGEDKDLDTLFGPTDHMGVEGGVSSFFELNFDFDHTSNDVEGSTTGYNVESSDTSLEETVFFDETELSSASSHNPTDTFTSSLSKQACRNCDHSSLNGFRVGQSSQTDQSRSQPSRTRDELLHLQQNLQSHDCAAPTRPNQYTIPIRSIPISVPKSQRLVHRLRPDGVSISREDLLSLEGRCRTPPILTRPKTPPSTPTQIKCEQVAPKTPRTPLEKGARIHKSRENLRTPNSKTMQPSNYYVGQMEMPSQVWSDRVHRLDTKGCAFNAQQVQTSGMPLSPPPSAKMEQQEYAVRFMAHPRELQILDSPTPTASHAEIGRIPLISGIALRNMISTNHTAPGHEHESLVPPMTSWMEGSDVGIAYDPVSPLLNEQPSWDTRPVAPVAQMQENVPFRSEYDETDYVESAETDVVEQQGFPGTLTSGLMIDFGNEDSSIEFEPTLLADQESISIQRDDNQVLQGTGAALSSGFSHGDNCPCDLPSCSVSMLHVAADKISKSGINSIDSKSRRRTGTSRKNTSTWVHERAQSFGDEGITRRTRRASSTRSLKTCASSPSISTCGATGMPRTNSRVACRAGSSRPGGRRSASSSGDMFVNFTPSDSRKILTGVAPSGSSKTKARREKEAIEKRRKLSEVAQRAVREAGGDWERVAGELVEV